MVDASVREDAIHLFLDRLTELHPSVTRSLGNLSMHISRLAKMPVMEGSAMEIVRFVDAPIYTSANHDEITAKRLQGGEATSAGFVLVGHSQFPPGAVVPMDVAQIGRIYVVAEGVVSVEQADGVRHSLQRWDSIFIPAGEARAVMNDSGAPAAIIVLTPQPPR